MRTPTDKYSSVRNRNFVDDVDTGEPEENEPLELTSVIHYLRTPVRPVDLCELYDRAAERLLAGSPWASSWIAVEEQEDPFPPIPPVYGRPTNQSGEDDPFPLLRPSSRPPPARKNLARRELAIRRKRAATLAAIIVAPFLILATYALVAVIAA